MSRLILGSSSPARRALLSRLQLPFEIIAPEADETPLPDEDAPTLVLRLAETKAKIIADQQLDALIISADQVGTLDGNILSKPHTPENAMRQLQTVSGKMVRFFTGICVYDANKREREVALETYDVYFRDLSKDMIAEYLKKEAALQCAGSFQAEGLGITLIDRFAGHDYTALIGLPLIRLVTMLEKAGCPVLV